MIISLGMAWLKSLWEKTNRRSESTQVQVYKRIRVIGNREDHGRIWDEETHYPHKHLTWRPEQSRSEQRANRHRNHTERGETSLTWLIGFVNLERIWKSIWFWYLKNKLTAINKLYVKLNKHLYYSICIHINNVNKIKLKIYE